MITKCTWKAPRVLRPGGKVKPAGGEDYGLHLSDSSEISFSLSLSLAINLPF